MDYTRLYANSSRFFLAKGVNRKTARDGSPMLMRFWEIGMGSVHVIVGRWLPPPDLPAHAEPAE
jgi:hypothetical protein